MLSQKSCELYVGDLEPNVDEQYLYNSFIRFGIIRSCKVMRHIVTHQSRGFGFVTFQNPSSVARAVEQMNGSLLFGKPIVVCSKEKYLYIEKNAMLLCLNLPDSFNEKSLNEMLNTFGNVFSKKFASQSVEKNEAPDRAVATKRRLMLQFENIRDALRFKKQYDGSDVDGKKLVIVFNNLNKNLNLKGTLQEDSRKRVEEKLKEFGEYSIISFEVNEAQKSFYSVVSFVNAINAREFFLNFRMNKKGFPLYSVTEIYDKMKRQNKKIECSFVKRDSLEEADLRKYVQENFQDLMSLNSEEGRIIVEFSSEQSLSKFVIEAQNKKSQLSGMIDESKGKIDYPRWLVKSLKAKRWNKMSSPFMPQQMYGMHPQQQQMMMNQYNQQMMMQMMQYNPQMMNQYNYQMRNNMNYMNNNNMNYMNNNNMNYMNNNNMNQNNLINNNMNNNNLNQTSNAQSDLSGLEIILNDTQNFKQMNKNEQNKIFMDIFVKKMEIIGDQRYKDSKFISNAAEYFLDDTVVDLEERLDIISENSKIQEFLKNLDEM